MGLESIEIEKAERVLREHKRRDGSQQAMYLKTLAKRLGTYTGERRDAMKHLTNSPNITWVEGHGDIRFISDSEIKAMKDAVEEKKQNREDSYEAADALIESLDQELEKECYEVPYDTGDWKTYTYRDMKGDINVYRATSNGTAYCTMTVQPQYGSKANDAVSMSSKRIKMRLTDPSKIQPMLDRLRETFLDMADLGIKFNIR